MTGATQRSEGAIPELLIIAIMRFGVVDGIGHPDQSHSKAELT